MSKLPQIKCMIYFLAMNTSRFDDDQDFKDQLNGL